MRLPKLFSRWPVFAGVLLSMSAVLILGVTQAAFNDIEISQNTTATAWTSTNWTQTSQSDLGSGVLRFVDATVAGSVQLTLGPFALRGGSNAAWEYGPSSNTWTVHATTPASVATGGALAYDGSNYVYAFRGGSTAFWRYDVLANTWATMATAPATIGTGGSLAYDGGDYIYALRGGSQTTFYRYSISGNSWTTRAATPGSISSGGALVFDGGNYLYALRGGTTTFYRYSISGNSWTTRASVPASIGAGGALAYDGGDYIYALRGRSQNNFYRYSISGNSWTTMASTPGTVSSGGALAYDGSDYIYAFRGGSTTTFYQYSISGNSWATKTSAPGTVGGGGALSDMIALGQVASQVLDTTVTGSRWDGLFWDETVPAGTNVTFEVRASDTAFLDTDVAPSWTAVGDVSPVISGLPAGRYKQWRATLSTTDVTQTPSLSEVRVYYYGPQ